MQKSSILRLGDWIYSRLFAVPVRVKVAGIMMLPVIILGVSLNYWVTTGLSDWLSHLLTDVRVEAAMQAGGRSVMIVTILGAALSIFLGIALTFVLTQPLIHVRNTARKVAAGEHDSRARILARDEIGEVAESINTMLDHMVAGQKDLAKTNLRLEVMNRVAMSADRELEIHDALYAILREMVELLPMSGAWVYLRDPERDVYHLASYYNIPPELQDLMAHAPGDPRCNCQCQAAEGELSGAGVQTCERMEAVTAWGGSHISIPIQLDEQKLGVINLICEDAPSCDHSEDDFELLTNLGGQISEIVSNAWLRMKLKEKEAARQILLESLVRAQEEERARLGRELHDGAGQTLTSLLVRLKALENRAVITGFENELEQSLELVSGTIQELREISYRLRPAALDELGLEAAVSSLIRDMCGDAGLECQLTIDLDGQPIPSEIEIGLYRIAQEGLTNIVRHSQANHVRLELQRIPHAIAMAIEDNGSGFDPDDLASRGHRGMGLLSMQERTELMGGSFDMYSAPGEGTLVQVRIPLVNEGQPYAK